MGASVYNVKSLMNTGGTSIPFNLPANGTDDLILCLVAVRNTGSTLGVTGYTALDTQARDNNSWRSRWFVKKAGTGGDTSLTVTSSSSGATNIVVYIIRGADVSGTDANAIDGIFYVSGGVGATCASPALTTTTNNCLLLNSVVWEATGILAEITDLNTLEAGYQTSSGVNFKATAGAISTFTWKGSQAAKSGLSWVVAVKSATATESIRSVEGRSYAIKLGGYDTVTTSAPDSVTGLTAINSVIMNTAANTISGTTTTSTGQPTTGPWPIDGLKISDTSALTATAWVGKFFAVTSVNVSGLALRFTFGFGGTVDNSRVGTNGMCVVLADASNNYLAYSVAEQSTWAIQGSGSITLLPGTSTTIASSGDPTAAVTKIGLFFQRSSASAAAVDIYMGSPIVQSSAPAIVGGDSTYPVSASSISMFLLGGNTFPKTTPLPLYTDAASLQGSGQIAYKTAIQIGDGSAKTYAKLSSQNFDIPSLSDSLWRSMTSAAGIAIKASASCTIDLSSTTITSSVLQPFTVDAASSLSASWTTTGLSIIGRTFSDLAGYDWTSVSWAECNTVAFKNGDVTTCTISSPNSAVHATTGAACSFSANGATVASSTINCNKASGVTGYHIALGASVTAITLNGVTLSGTPGTDKIYSALASGTLTITTDGLGTSLVAGDVTFVGGSSAVAVIAAPQVYQKVTVSGFTAGSRIQIYDTTSSTELFNGTATAGDTVVSGSTAVWTDPTAAAADRAIRVRVAYISGVTAEQWQQFSGLTCGQTGTTEEITYPVTPIDDTTYNDNGINGPAIYATSGITFTDAATDLVNISIAGGTVSWPTIYACFVYWLSTAAGIDDDVAYIDAPDTANYLLTSMKIKNTHANPLTVTGGYGRSATTGLVADIIDAAGSTGNIYPSPDHVVAYATGSGSLTAGDITNIWAASTRTITTTIPTATQNATEILGTAVDGTTTVAESMRLRNSVLGGKLSGAGTGTETFRDLADTKNRVVATVDSSGNRTAITRDLT